MCGQWVWSHKFVSFIESRKRKLEGPTGKKNLFSNYFKCIVITDYNRQVKVARPPSPTTLGPGELFFRADPGTRSAPPSSSNIIIHSVI